MTEPEVTKLIVKGAALAGTGKPKEAMECFDKAIEIDPENVHAWICKAGMSANFKQSMKHYNTAIEIDPKYEAAWYLKGTALSYYRKHEEAMECFDKAIEINPKYVDAWYRKGVALLDIGMKTVGLHLWLNQGKNREKERYINEAIGCFNKVIEIEPKNEAAWSLKGSNLSRLGKDQEAMECFDKIIEINSKSVSAWFIKGNICCAPLEICTTL